MAGADPGIFYWGVGEGGPDHRRDLMSVYVNLLYITHSERELRMHVLWASD